MDLRSKILLIYGPTASGKSLFAIKLAKKINGEIVNADSMQVYKELKILSARPLKKDFQKASEIQKASSINFSKLLEMCALSNPKMRIRFSTSNPQDMSLEVIKVMSRHDNICNHIHLPVQSGSDKILKDMNRQHSIEEYLNLISNRKVLFSYFFIKFSLNKERSSLSKSSYLITDLNISSSFNKEGWRFFKNNG